MIRRLSSWPSRTTRCLGIHSRPIWNGDFKNSFEHALRSYARDADQARPNPYPRECWPSAEDFRVILYAAGRFDEESGARLLDRIPDIGLRLFAGIEFAAGIAGVAQIGSITRERLRGH